MNAYKGTSYEEAPSLFVELDGGDEEVASTREVCGWENVTAFEAVTAAEARMQLWDARHNAAFAVAAAAPGKRWFATDVCVPLSVLPDAVEHGRASADRRSIPAAVIAHAADGNFHLAVMVDPEDAAEVGAARALYAELVDWALARGGTSTGSTGSASASSTTSSASTATCCRTFGR